MPCLQQTDGHQNWFRIRLNRDCSIECYTTTVWREVNAHGRADMRVPVGIAQKGPPHARLISIGSPINFGDKRYQLFVFVVCHATNPHHYHIKVVGQVPDGYDSRRPPKGKKPKNGCSYFEKIEVATHPPDLANEVAQQTLILKATYKPAVHSHHRSTTQKTTNRASKNIEASAPAETVRSLMCA